MNLLLLSLLFSVSIALICRPSPDFDFDQLALTDPEIAANYDWLTIRDRRAAVPFASSGRQLNGKDDKKGSASGTRFDSGLSNKN